MGTRHVDVHADVALRTHVADLKRPGVLGGRVNQCELPGGGADITPPAATQTPSFEDAVLCEVCRETRQLAKERCPDVVEIYLDEEHVPDEFCQKH